MFAYHNSHLRRKPADVLMKRMGYDVKSRDIKLEN